jgi:hypothetical protein
MLNIQFSNPKYLMNDQKRDTETRNFPYANKLF